jgi:hypothetical protein
MTASFQLRGKLNVEYLYGICHENGSKILGIRVCKFNRFVCMYDMERVQAMNLHERCFAMFVYVWVHGFNAF